jgi:hypothetical protein
MSIRHVEEPDRTYILIRHKINENVRNKCWKVINVLRNSTGRSTVTGKYGLGWRSYCVCYGLNFVFLKNSRVQAPIG